MNQPLPRTSFDQTPFDLVNSVNTNSGNKPMESMSNFTIRAVRTDEQLAKVVDLRAEAYGRHIPSLKDILSAPDDVDKGKNSIILIAESLSTRETIGTLRIQIAQGEPLLIEESIILPSHISTRPRVGVTRLAVSRGQDSRFVKLMLFKGLLQYCLAAQMDWIVVAAREPLHREYVRLGFIETFGQGHSFPIRSLGNLNHRILHLSIRDRERIYYETNHPLHAFFFVEHHPQIRIFDSVLSMWSKPRHPELKQKKDVSDALRLPIV